jgi:succinate-semialdehyde dehydrogenase/glutarate-semialdehyde dehydrogenase
MKLYYEETFGPVATIYKVSDDDEAVEIANATRFGLASSVWSQDTERAMQVADKIEAGAVFINGIVKSDPRLPFGGIKKSGFGRELSTYGIKEFCNVKTYWVK